MVRILPARFDWEESQRRYFSTKEAKQKVITLKVTIEQQREKVIMVSFLGF